MADPAKLPDHEERLTVARRVAAYEIGDPDWADPLVAAYCNPRYALEQLAERKEP